MIPNTTTYKELVQILKEKEKSSQQQTKNKQRTKILRKRIKNG
jgi:hypothetical protein|tara:strand:+ start:766 stop:894 length:129 start_codon:yes stop_codon:yes gene_type:complete